MSYAPEEILTMKVYLDELRLKEKTASAKEVAETRKLIKYFAEEILKDAKEVYKERDKVNC